LASRELSPWEAGVVSVTRMEAGTTSNIIPEFAVLEGTLRALSEDIRQRLLAGVERVASRQAESFRAEARVQFGKDGYPPTVNDEAAAAYASSIAAQVFGPGCVSQPEHPYMTAEDFSYYLRA